jgi:threonyl-tRNA synthetase
MIHTAKLGSVERFIGILIENCAGKFPLWLAPVQVKLATVTDANADYANEVARALELADVRVTIDDRNEKIGRKIRDNELKRIPYMLIVGEKEQETKTLSVRRQGAGDLGAMSVEEFAKLVNDEVYEQTSKYLNK